MDSVAVNGGNAEVACEGFNLETVEQPEKQSEQKSEEPMEVVEENVQEVNGDVKDISSPGKRNLRKTKANSTSTVESDAKPKMKGRKRKLSEPDINSEDSVDFSGFDKHCFNNSQTGNLVLQKLIAEAELSVAPKPKRGRPSRKSFLSEEDSAAESIKPLKESESDSTEKANNIESEGTRLKSVEVVTKSSDSSVNSSTPILKLRGTRLSRGVSPPSTGKHKVDLTNPAFQEPFKHGWKRELVFRGTGFDANMKKMSDIYYITPKGKKVRSFREVSTSLTAKENLTLENFTFHKEALGLNDPEKEIIREARKGKDATPITKTPNKKVGAPAKKSTTPKKAEDPPESTPLVKSPPPLTKAVAKAAKTPATLKVKAAKKTPLKKETKQQKQLERQPSPALAASEVKENEMLPPQKNSPATRRSQQAAEKTLSPKAKRALKAKVLEPCSIRCSTSMGQIPSLQCCVCLCLYHPECVNSVDHAGSDDYVCENCRQDTEETVSQLQPLNSSLTPPPLIPISMLNTSNAKSKLQGNLAPPKLQRIPKADGSEPHLRIASKHSKAVSVLTSSAQSDKKEAKRFAQTENDFLHSYDGIVPKPAQNIATMAGKRYIIVPKNNTMSVQPAITLKPDKIGDKPPTLQKNSATDNSNVTENQSSQVAATEEPIEKVASKKDNEVLADKPEANHKDENNDQKVKDNSKDVSKDDSKDASKDTSKSEETPAEPPKDNLITMDVDSNELSDHVIQELEDIRFPEVEPPAKKKLKKLEAKNRRSSQNKYLANGTTHNNDNFKVENSNSVDDRTSTAILNIARAGIKKKQIQAETDQRQHFMVSVCAGYHALSKIFQYLKVQELLRAARVCKMWRDLAAHPSLWKTVRMKNSQVTDWDGLAETLKRRGTQHLDLRKMLVSGDFDTMWKKFVSVIPQVTSLVKLELCRCSEVVVEEVIKNCPQLEVLSALTIKCEALNLESVGNLKKCHELRLKSVGGMQLKGDLAPLQELTQLTHLSLTSIKELGKKKLEVLQSLVNLETLELGECSDFPEKFGTEVLVKLNKLERLRFEKGQGLCCTFDILEGVSKMENLTQLELVNFDVKNGFDKCLASCTNIKRLLIIPTYISQSATSNNMVLAGVIELSNNLTHFVWGVTLELLRVTELFVDQCNQMSKPVSGESIPVLKPVPCLKLIQDVEEEPESKKGEDDMQPSVANPQVDILPLSQLQKLLLTALPKTRVKILKIPFNATWRQNISDTTAQ
ncbi:uncharacterized protein LOC117166881 [Belonocnema kinseyi]|uniref:uncharacterized protein LOC117166881 n=1 Tax=Belonocnema kinseyi TaxID=2817044 RepID=UPI00143CEAE4|nr:uncharacterized protein LOC117166881 [Belonocnema kinseyi]